MKSKLILASIVTFSTLVTGCGGKDDSAEGGKVKISLAHFADPHESKLVQQQVAEFEKLHPEIDVVAEPFTGDFFEVLKTRMASNKEPDVFYMDIVQKDQFIDAERLLPLNEYVKEADLEDFQTNLLDAFKEGNQVYGLPKDTNTLALFYNKKMLKDAGVEPPKTWEELKTAAKKLTKDKVTGLVLINELPRFNPILDSFGGGVMEKDVPVVNSAKNVEALNYWFSYFKDGVAQTPKDLGVGWSGDAFAQEMVAMAIEGGWMIQSLMETAPNLEYGVVELPVKEKPATLMFTVAYAASKNTKHPAEAVKLIEFLTSKEAQQMTVDAGKAMPSRVSMQQAYLDKYPEREAFVKGIDYATPFNYGIVSPVVISETTKAAERVILGQMTTKQSFDDAQKKIDEALANQK